MKCLLILIAFLCYTLQVEAQTKSSKKFQILLVKRVYEDKSYLDTTLKVAEEAFPDMKINLEWESPNFKLVTGECEKRSKLGKMMKQIRKNFPDAKIVPCSG